MGRVRSEHPHWPLVIMTVLTQLSVGAFVAIWLLQLSGRVSRLGIAAIVAQILGGVALGASTMHLGRPIHAYRALRMWKRSWLSREVLMFGLFSAVALPYAATFWLRVPGSVVLGALTSLFGIAGIFSSARIYVVRARPAWDSMRTVVDFFVTAALLGSLLAFAVGIGERRILAFAVVIAALARLSALASRFIWLRMSDVFERQASANLLSTMLSARFKGRVALLLIGGVVLPVVATGYAGAVLALLLSFGGEILGRYLFFISVVPKNMAASYLAPKGQAA